MALQIPDPPPEQTKEARTVAPVQFLETPPPTRIPEGIVHPSLNTSHSFTLADQPVEYEQPEEEEPGDDDRRPLLAEADPNALKGAAVGT